MSVLTTVNATRQQLTAALDALRTNGCQSAALAVTALEQHIADHPEVPDGQKETVDLGSGMAALRVYTAIYPRV